MSSPIPEKTDEAYEAYLRRIFTSGYMLGKRHGYSDAVEESYPELKDGQNEIGREVLDSIQDYLNPHHLPRRNPSEDFS